MSYLRTFIEWGLDLANEEHVKRLKQGVLKWNAWREKGGALFPDLRDADLRDGDLKHADLFVADLKRADLKRVNLACADLSGANLTGANLFRANLTSANLFRTTLSGANLTDANMSRARLSDTVFGRVDLTNAVGLETCWHQGPSIIDHQTIQKSGRLPLPFLRGVGLPDRLIEYLPSLFEQAIQYY